MQLVKLEQKVFNLEKTLETRQPVFDGTEVMCAVPSTRGLTALKNELVKENNVPISKEEVREVFISDKEAKGMLTTLVENAVGNNFAPKEKAEIVKLLMKGLDSVVAFVRPEK